MRKIDDKMAARKAKAILGLIEQMDIEGLEGHKARRKKKTEVIEEDELEEAE